MPCIRLIVSALCAAWLLGACVTTPHAAPASPVSATDIATTLDVLPPTRLLLLGEQHDADAHQALQRAAVEHLASQGRLAALVLEMSDRGTHTRGLARDATESEVQAQLQWNDEGWPWRRYGPVVMAAVRTGVPVLGGNQPRSEMRGAMSDVKLDTTLAPPALEQQRENIDTGHCGLLPAGQLAPMARIQIARDRAMAQTLTELAPNRTDQTVLLVAGTEHVRRGLGVPVHLAPALASSTQVVVMHSGTPAAGTTQVADGADRVWLTPATEPKDHCAELRQHWRR